MKIISSAPTRISLFGGGTDLPVYYEKYGGITIGMAINIRQQFTYYGDEKDEKGLLGNPKFAKTICNYFGFDPGGLFQSFDAPIESGLGSSAAAAVALIGLAKKVKGLTMDRYDIANFAYKIENNELNMYGGRQDQLYSAIGGFNIFRYLSEKKQKFSSLKDPLNNIYPWLEHEQLPQGNMLRNYMLLIYTGANRKNSKIQEELKTLSKKQIKALDWLKYLALSAEWSIKCFSDLNKMANGIGMLLDSSWEFKKISNKFITTEKIDKIYDKAKKAGAIGGKLLGSGGGGFMVFIAPPDRHKYIIKKLEKIKGVKNYDFDICWNGLEVRKI